MRCLIKALLQKKEQTDYCGNYGGFRMAVLCNPQMGGEKQIKTEKGRMQ